MGLAALKRIQGGKEGTRGTAVAATAKWTGITAGHRLGDREVRQPVEDRGSLAAAFRSYTPSLLWQDTLRGSVTYEDAILLFSMALAGGITPTTVDTTARLWTFTPNLTAATNPDTFTVEIGDDTQCYEAEYVFCESLELTGAVGEEVQVSANVVGRQLSTSTFTPALADRTVESALAQKTTLYMDDTGGTMGTTPKTGLLMDWRWRLPAFYIRKRTMDGNSYFTAHSQVKLQPQLELTCEFTSAVHTLRGKYTGETRQLVRLKTTGTQVGGVSAVKTLQIDGAYKITGLETLDERDGASTVRMTLSGEYDSGWGKLIEIQVQNSLSTLP